VPALLVLPSSAQVSQEAGCELQGGPTRAVVRIIDSETVQLDDNLEVRLIGALAPRAPDMRPDAQPWPPEQQAKAALRDLVLGRSVKLAFAEQRFDRYGRLLAHLFLDRDGERTWVQGTLLTSGHARAYGLPGSFACMPELLAHERVAREARTGLWSHAAYAARRALRPRAILRKRNTYQIVEGRVAHVAPTKSRTYLNFGTDWRSDFTAGIDARLLRAYPEWAGSLADLEGRRIEVRGWIEYRNGPYINVEDPSQIEAMDEDAPASASQAPAARGDHAVPPQIRKRPATKRPGAVDL
jgi:endonuclease YncB( thermonuclease family)